MLGIAETLQYNMTNVVVPITATFGSVSIVNDNYWGGSALSGTWRCRGFTGGAYGGFWYLIQRVA
jgi:uncharacterized membrane protein